MIVTNKHNMVGLAVAQMEEYSMTINIYEEI